MSTAENGLTASAAGDKDDDDNEPLTLSADTFAALNEFYQEQDARDREREDVLREAANQDSQSLSMDSFTEDWQLSQFWYDDATSDALARECVRAAGEGGRVACVSCPSLFFALRRLFPGDEDKDRARLFEFDKRFAKVGQQFVFYDYKSPLDIPR